MTADILFNSPALHSLKREQLVKLCKKHGIKASGKNVDLVDKLKAHAATLSPDALDTAPHDYDQTSIASDNEGDATVATIILDDPAPRMSEQWEVLQDVTAQDDQFADLDLPKSKSGTVSSSSSKLQSEFGGDHSGSKGQTSTVGSSIKSFASSLMRAGSVLALNKAASSSRLDLAPMDIDEEVGNYSLFASAKEYDSASLALAPALCNEDAPPDDPDAPPTIRLVSGPSLSWGSETPALKPFTTAFQLADNSPIAGRKLYPTLEDDVPSVPPSPTRLAQPTPSRTPSQRRSPLPPPFVFGSPEAKVSNSQFQSAANAVLDEMNKRLGVVGTSAALDLNILDKDKTHLPAQNELIGLGGSGNGGDRFARAHEAHFGKMDSILNHYAARRNSPDRGAAVGGKRKAGAMEEDEKKRLFMTAEEDGEETRSPKRQRVQVAEPQAVETVVVKNDDVKRKLEISRARRRSSRGRASVGPTPGPVKGGFMLTAKSFVSRVWSRSTATKPAVKPAPVKSSLAPKAAPPQVRVTKPALGPVSKPSTLSSTSQRVPSVRSTPQPQGLGRKVSTSSKAADMSITSTRTARSSGIPSFSGATSRKSSTSSRSSLQPGPVRPRTESRLMAPTASSLARMQNPVRTNKSSLASVRETPSAIPPVPPLPTLAPITNAPATTAATGESAQDGTTVVVKPKPAPLAPRRPRISRSKVIAKLGEKRAASHGTDSLKHTRRSLAAKERIGDKRMSIEHAARKRIRQSELHRAERKL